MSFSPYKKYQDAFEGDSRFSNAIGEQESVWTRKDSISSNYNGNEQADKMQK